MKDPMITIITPSYNQGEFLERTIKSVINQDYKNIEYIIMDGGSTDCSVDIIKKYEQKISYWESKKDKGQSHAINQGWMKSRGDIIGWLNSDDELVPGILSTISEAFKINSNIGMIYGDWIYIDKHSNQIDIAKGNPTTFRKFLAGSQEEFLAQPSTFFNRKILNTVGYLDESLFLAMDYEFILRILQKYDSQYIPTEFSRFRVYPETKSGSYSYEHWKEKILVKKRFGRRISLQTYINYTLFLILNNLPIFIQNPIRKIRNSIHDKYK